MNATQEYQLLSEIRDLGHGSSESAIRAKRTALLSQPEKVQQLCAVVGIRATGSLTSQVNRLVKQGQRFAENRA